jgi:hypothetical protein
LRVTIATAFDLAALARRYQLAPALALGLGAGLYFEYYRRAQPAPTRFITGLNRALESSLAARHAQYIHAPRDAARAALRENALWFNLDRQPATALLGLEMLAEELVYYDTQSDWRVCLRAMAGAIDDHEALYRGVYILFLQEIARLLDIQPLIIELQEIAAEWTQFAAYLNACAVSENVPDFEKAGRLARRLAFREEHFWGKALDL